MTRPDVRLTHPTTTTGAQPALGSATFFTWPPGGAQLFPQFPQTTADQHTGVYRAQELYKLVGGLPLQTIADQPDGLCVGQPLFAVKAEYDSSRAPANAFVPIRSAT